MAVLLSLLTIPTTARSTIVTFDELPYVNDSRPLPNGYAGFTWNNFYMVDGVHFRSNPSGYEAGVVSPNNVASNGFGNPATIVMSDGSPFNFTGAYLTAAWNDGLSVRVQGFLTGVQVYDTTVNPSATAPTFFTFNYGNVDQLLFSAFGGTHHSGYDGGSAGTHFAMDNFTFSAVPEPGTGLLVIAGLISLAGGRRASA